MITNSLWFQFLFETNVAGPRAIGPEHVLFAVLQFALWCDEAGVVKIDGQTGQMNKAKPLLSFSVANHLPRPWEKF